MVRLEAVASRFEDFEVSARQSLTQGNVSAIPDGSVPHTAHPPSQGLSLPPAIVVEPVTPPSVVAFDTIVIDGKLSPFMELTKAFAPQLLIDQVSSLHSFSCTDSYRS